MNLDELEALLRDSNPGVVPILSERILAMIAVIRAADAMRNRESLRDLPFWDDYDRIRATLEDL